MKHSGLKYWLAVQYVGAVLSMGSAFGDGLRTFEGCTFIGADWADGDSFPVKLANGDDLTIRLYGVDCVEWGISDDSDARRLRSQRRYFGIAEHVDGPAASIELAKRFGEMAANEVAEVLKSPFTIHTAMADGRGDERYSRVYGFVELSDGRDLGEYLVSKGLARAYGVSRSTYNSRSRDEYRAHLEDLELIAAKTGSGIWAETQWAQISDERRIARLEEEEDELSKGTGKLMDGEKIDINTASRDELMKLPGIGESLANAIVEARPVESDEALDEVSGIGDATLKKILPFVRFEP